MFKNYLITTIRNIKKNLLFSALNSFGLAIGIMISIFIVSWILDELNYDKFNVKHEKIYRLERYINWRDFNLEMPITSGPYKQALIDNFPLVVNAVRITPQEAMLKDQQNIYRKNKIFFVDGSILEMFSFSVLAGDYSALMEPNSIVLTENMSERLLGSSETVGKTIRMEYAGIEYNLKINAVIEEFPSSSHFHPEILISLSTLYPTQKEALEDWIQNTLYTYVELKDKNDDAKILSQFPEFLETQVGPRYASILNEGETINDMMELKLKSLSDIHLHSQLEFELENNGNITLIYLFGAVAFLILIIASINFINLSTAKGESRSLEVGIRKVSGAQKKQLILQFIFESVLISFLSFLIAIVLSELLAPFYTNITGKEFEWILLSNLRYFILLLAILIFTGILSGIYPAFYLTSFNPLKILKAGKSISDKKGSFRMILVTFQFFISISFIILSMLIFFQLDFIAKKDIGYNKNNMIVVPVDSKTVQRNYDSFKNDLLSNPVIFKNITSAAELTTSHMYEAASMKKLGTDDAHFMIFMNINYDFIETLNLNLLAGRSYQKEYTDTAHNRYILNETALKNFGWQNPDEAIGEKIELVSNTSNNKTGEIIGIIKDFHFKSIHQEIEPLVFKLIPEKLSYIYIRVNPNQTNEAINHISKLWTNKFPEAEFNYFFLSDVLENQYSNERLLKDKLIISTLLAILIACLGLLGLSLFIIKQKTKEIGVRKVLGASVQSIVKLLSFSYLKWVGVSTIMAWPISYWIINKWLQNFSVQISLINYWWVFLLSGILGSLITLLVVSVQSIKYASVNPATILKYE